MRIPWVRVAALGSLVPPPRDTDDPTGAILSRSLMPIIRALASALVMSLAATTMSAQEPDWSAASRETLANLQSMIRMNTVNPPGNELQVARFLEGKLKDAGIETHLFEPAPGRGSLVARIRGNASKRPVLI